MEKVLEIEIKKIKITENHRVNIEKTSLDDMMQSIKQRGVLQPIGLAPHGKGAYKLRFGQRRLLACQKLGYKTIRAIVSREMNEEDLMLENLTENLQRNDPSFGEIGRMIHKLEDKGLSLKEIAVRLGITFRKAKQVYDVYNYFPEKYRSRVAFLTPGSGRKKVKGGSVPAQVATKIINMKRHHGLNDTDVGHIFEDCSKKGTDASDLTHVGDLIAGGMPAKQALENMRDYGSFTFEVVAKHTDIAEMLAKHGVLNKRHLFKKIIYGELPPLVKPSWVNTGLIIKKPVVKIESKTKYKKMRDQLVKLGREGELSETQLAALKPTKGVNFNDWSEEQCNQIAEMVDKLS